MGAYRRTPIRALEREADVPPLAEYIEAATRQRAVKSADHPVTRKIQKALKQVYDDCTRNRKRRRKRNLEQILSSQDDTRRRALLLVEQRQAQQGRQRRRQQRHRSVTVSQSLLAEAWQAKWQKEADKPARREATWKDPWKDKPLLLYSGLSKAEATALFLLRTEVIGLNDWLARARVPDVDPMCPCGQYRQTVNHILHFCPLYRIQRARLQSKTANLRPGDALGDAKTAAAVAKWFVKLGVLSQFNVARDLQEEDTSGWTAPRPLRGSW